jgi:hypothetical protein
MRPELRSVDELFPDRGPAGPVFTLEEWGRPDGWRTFLFPAELGRSFVQNLSIRSPGGRIYSVMHCDMECRFSTPPRTEKSAGFYSFPWPNPDSAFAMGVHHTPPGRRQEFRALETDLVAGDLALGRGADKLGRLLRALGREAKRRDLVLLNLTCLPAKTGDGAAVPSMLARSGIEARVLYNDPDVDQSVPPVLAMVRDRIEKILKKSRKKKRRRRPAAVNLIGFPRSTEKNELKGLLAEMGIRVNADLIPDIDLGAVEDLFAAPVSVFFPEARYRSLYRHLFAGTGLMGLAPPPFGLQGSRAWLGQVGAALGLDRSAAGLWKSWWSGRKKAWKELRSEAVRHGVGFIGTDQELCTLDDPLQTAGVPIFSMLREMGFKAVRFVFREGSAGGGERRQDAWEFSTPGELESSLAASRCRLAYSDVRFDRRLTALGMLPLSAARFRMGPEGCLRTLEFLTSACGLDLFRKYRAGPTPRGKKP